MPPQEAPTAAMLVIGNEILSGRTQDKNVVHVAKRMSDLGVRLSEVRVVPDVRDRIVAAVRELSSAWDYLITTGGIGPTHDDITTECVAVAMGVEVERNAEAHRRLRAHYEGTEIELNEARLRMANIPVGATLIDNPVSAAPGFRLANVFVLAGVPAIMKAMLAVLEPQLVRGPPLRSRTLVVSRPEGLIAGDLAAVATEYPDVDIGSYPFYRPPDIGTSLVLRAADPDRLDQCADAVRRFLTRLGAPFREEP
ncbi:MAG: molybdopterin-binding protein [Rhodospirillales bacterium]|nr:molybdopterin-binding protein [Rhodospirillales bacterium]